MVESTSRRTAVQACPCSKQDPISKITNTNRVRDIAQVVECPPSKCKVLSSIPGIIKKIKKTTK
jgi:hypothetical protein